MGKNNFSEKYYLVNYPAEALFTLLCIHMKTEQNLSDLLCVLIPPAVKTELFNYVNEYRYF